MALCYNPFDEKNKNTKAEAIWVHLANYTNSGYQLAAAGTGYQLLRLAYLDRLPSVLLWE